MNWYWWTLIGLVALVVLVPNIILHIVVLKQGFLLWENKYRYTLLPPDWPIMKGKSFVWKLLFRGYFAIIHPQDHMDDYHLDVTLAHECKGHIDHMIGKRLPFPVYLLLYFIWPAFRAAAECMGFADGLVRREAFVGAYTPVQLEKTMRARAKKMKKSYLLWGLSNSQIYDRLRKEYRKAKGAVK